MSRPTVRISPNAIAALWNTVLLRYSEASGRNVDRTRCFGVPQHDKRVTGSFRTLFAFLMICWTGEMSLARNVDLSTVPARDSVQLTIYNSEDLTLVRETRKVTFKRGANPLQFSWANTLIDPTSVELKFLTSAEKLEVLDTTFPHDKPQMLYWNVQSDFDGEASIEITCFTSGITWSADYLCTASKDESSVGLRGFVRINNNSGEEYEDAQVRLVVGRINLVEKIAQLAHLSDEEFTRLGRGERRVGAWRRKPRMSSF